MRNERNGRKKGRFGEELDKGTRCKYSICFDRLKAQREAEINEKLRENIIKWNQRERKEMERKGEGVCSSCCHANEGGALAMLTNSSSHGWTHHLLMLPPPFPSLYPFISPLLSPGFSFLNAHSLTRLLLLGSVCSRDSSWVGGAVVACGAACKAASVCCACTSFTRGKNGFKWCRWIRGGNAELMRNWVTGLGYRQQRSSTHLSGHQGSVFFLFFRRGSFHRAYAEKRKGQGFYCQGLPSRI